MLILHASLILFILISHNEALPQTKWSKSIPSSRAGQLVRERRQFPFGEWIPISQQCPTCRPFADPLDVGFRGEDIGLTPPRPPTTRQIHSEGNFFNQDESSILSVPPPPPSAIPRHPITNNNGNFRNLQFSSFPQQFNSPLPVPTQQVFPQTSQIQFLPQSFLPNQQILVSNNQQVLPALNNPNALFDQENQSKQKLTDGKTFKFNSDFKTSKLPENVLLEQNKRPGVQQQQQQFFNKPTPLTLLQHEQQVFSKQQQQQQYPNKIGDSILTPPPVPGNATQQIVIPGLDKEEIQLLYVPVETLRQRGNFQEQSLTQQSPNIQFKRPSPSPLSPTNIPTEPTTKTPKGHFVTNDVNLGQAINTLKVSTVQPFPTPVTSSPLLLQQLPFQQTSQAFFPSTPATPTIQSFVTSTPQQFSSFAPETTLPQLITYTGNVKFSQPDVGFGSTPKVILNQEALKEQINDKKTQSPNLKGLTFQNVNQQRVVQQQKPELPKQQSFANQPNQSERQTEPNNSFFQQQQKIIEFQNPITNKQTSLQNQQDHQLLSQQQKEKELQEQYLLKQSQQKQLEAQQLLQREKELEKLRLLQEQKQKELEQQQLLQLQRQKELEEQSYLQQQKQKELERQQYLQQQREKELENQRQLQLQRQQELEEKRRLQQLKQKEEEQRLLYLQRQQQKELEEQRLIKQREEQQRLIKQREEQQRLILQKQKQENFKKQQQIPFYQQQVKQQIPQQPVIQQVSEYTPPANDKVNSVLQLEKESEPDINQQLVPHQPPLSVFYKSDNGAEAQIVDVLRELRRSHTITVLDQYFEKIPKVFVGPAGLIPPPGFRKFELPYLSNLETNKIERKIDRLPFFVAPLNFIPPAGYAKIPFPAPHVGSVVVSSDTNPAMRLQSEDKKNSAGVETENESESFPVVGPELPGLINNLETKTTTPKSISFPSTPSLPQTTAQLRNRRPNSNLYRTQNRRPISKPKPETTSKPEEVEATPTPKTEQPKDSEIGFKKPFNRFLQRRRQQAKTTTETPVKSTQSAQQGKTLENRFYTVEVYHKQKNPSQFPKSQLKNDILQDHKFNGPSQRPISTIDRSTPGETDVYEVSPTPGLLKEASIESDERIPDNLSHFQTFENGPLPTGSDKSIAQELYRPQISGEEQIRTIQPDEESSYSFKQLESSSQENQKVEKPEEVSGINQTGATVSTSQGYAITEEITNNPLTFNIASDKQIVPQRTSEQYFYGTDSPRTDIPLPSGLTTLAPQQQQPAGVDDSEHYTSGFAEVSKHPHFSGFINTPIRESTKYSDPQPTPQVSYNLPEAKSGFSQRQPSQEYSALDIAQPTQTTQFSNGEFQSTGTSNEKYLSDFDGVSVQQNISNVYDLSNIQITPTAAEVSQDQFTTHFLSNPNSQEVSAYTEGSQNGDFGYDQKNSKVAVFENFNSNFSSHEYVPPTISSDIEIPQTIDQKNSSLPPEGISEVTESLYRPTHNIVSEESLRVHNEGSTTEGRIENLSNDHRLKIPNPSIVRVRTRVKGKSRGQVNYVSSQSTTQAPLYRSNIETKSNVDKEQDDTKNISKDYQFPKVTKYNQYRGLKKGVRTTTEASTEYEQKANVYTIRPQRRPANPSTVSTKRIRRPTTPVATAETSTEFFGISSQRPYYQSENPELSPSGFSNDVYYEHTSHTPIRQKFRKHFGTAEQKSDTFPEYSSTAFPTTAHFVAPTFLEDYQDKDVDDSRDLSPVAAVPQENSEKYPEWNPSQSSIDISEIALTTIRPISYEEQEVEEAKKLQDTKKAFDPDFEKKGRRRRVRVRVHKRPHENFETAESQNLRTVANVLVPPTSTYKPNDDVNIHQLAKNSDFSFGGQKLFTQRSREYFRKRLNITQIEPDFKQTVGNQTKEEQFSSGTPDDNVKGVLNETDALKHVKKTAPKNEDSDSVALSEVSEGAEGKTLKSKQRSFVRKVIKHKINAKVAETFEPAENEENKKKQESTEGNLKQENKNFNETGRFNENRHRTIVRYVKKNKIKPLESEPVEKPALEEVQKEEKLKEVIKSTEYYPTNETETYTEHPKIIQNSNEVTQTINQSDGNAEQLHNKQINDIEPNQTQTPLISQTQVTDLKDAQTSVPDIQEPETEPTFSSSSSTSANPRAKPSTTEIQPQSVLTQTRESFSIQKTRFNQAPRNFYPKSSFSGFQSNKRVETQSVKTEQFPEIQDKRDGPIRPKFGNFGVFATESNQTEEVKRVNDFQVEQKIKNKNFHTLEVRKYLRTKSREGAFSQFSKNRYFTSEKTETLSTTKESDIKVKELEESTTPFEEASSPKIEAVNIETETRPETTKTTFVEKDFDEEKTEKTRTNEDSELNFTVTDKIQNYSDEVTTEQATTEEDDKVSTSILVETTTDIKTESPATVYTSNGDWIESTTEWKPEEDTTTEKTEAVQTETQPDLYRFSKSSFNFDEAEKFAGTQNRAYVRNITTDIIENTASFSAPGIEKRIVSQKRDEELPQTTESLSDVTVNDKTEEAFTQHNGEETATAYSEVAETESVTAKDPLPIGKTGKFVKTSTTTKISHETEICYKGKCIRTKSENPDEDLKLLVDSSSTKKVEGSKT